MGKFPSATFGKATADKLRLYQRAVNESANYKQIVGSLGPELFTEEMASTAANRSSGAASSVRYRNGLRRSTVNGETLFQGSGAAAISDRHSPCVTGWGWDKLGAAESWPRACFAGLAGAVHLWCLV
jgi:hypothetical protein